jgi:polyisoprenoid-binding protein YceI
MTKRTYLLVTLGAAALLLAQPAGYVMEPAQTTVEFTLGDVLHTVKGTFKLKRASLSFDSKSGAAAGELVVDAASGESGSPARDRRMHAEILESGKYPEIVFRPDRVEGVVAPEGKSQVQFHGSFSIHGAAHELTIPAAVEASGGQYRVTATFTVPYVKWGMKNPSNFLLRVNQTVEIRIQATAHQAAERP